MICQASLIENYHHHFLSLVNFFSQKRLASIWLIIAKWCHPQFIRLRVELVFSFPK